jgi:L,D-peptidoglycan transpeptidase YkuD (ErfK/YbiS/YcfS/YnhG family)
VIRYNADPVVPGRGSAIFLHGDVGGPTNGCVSLPAGELDFVLRWLDPARKPQIVIIAPA